VKTFFIIILSFINHVSWECHKYLGLNMFLVLQVSAKFGISPSKTFDQFSHSSFKMREFSPFNQILLSLYDVSNTFHDSI